MYTHFLQNSIASAGRSALCTKFTTYLSAFKASQVNWSHLFLSIGGRNMD